MRGAVHEIVVVNGILNRDHRTVETSFQAQTPIFLHFGDPEIFVKRIRVHEIPSEWGFSMEPADSKPECGSSHLFRIA